MKRQMGHTQISRENAWWYIPKEHISALRILENKLNDSVYSKDALTRDEALEILKKGLTIKDRANVEKILEHFIHYYEMSNNVLWVAKDKSLTFRIKCEIIGTYSEDFANARIILECLLKNRTGCVGKSSLHSTMNDLIDPNDNYKDYQHNIEKNLERKYKDKFKEAIKLLQKANLAELETDKIKKINSRQSGGRSRNTYKLSQDFLNDTFNDEEENIYAKAIQKLWRLRLKSKLKGNTATNKKEIKHILDAKEYITQRISTISLDCCSKRAVFHWFSMFMVMKYAHVDTSRVLDDIITYIRYNNIKFTPIPVKEKKLSKWEAGYNCWNAFEELLSMETSIPIIWRTSITEEEYEDATSRLIYDISEVLSSLESYVKSIAKAKKGKDDSLIEWILDIKFSLLYVRATIELNSSHNDALGHFESLFKIIAQKQGFKNYYDLCLVVSKLSRLACEDTFEYISKAKKWIHSFNNIHGCESSYDVQNVLVDIYLHIIGMSSEVEICNKYIEKCRNIINKSNPDKTQISEMLELVTNKYLYLLYSMDYMCYSEVAALFSDLWENLKDVFKIASSDDPRPHICKIDIFILAADYFNKYFDFGYSLALLATQAYISLKSIGAKDYMSYFYILEGLGNFIEPYEPDVALRAKIKIAPNYHNKQFIYNDITRKLFDRGNIKESIEYAEIAEQFFDKNNLNDLDSLSYYIDTKLSKIKSLFLIGRTTEAKSELRECGSKLSHLEELYPHNDQSCILRGVIDLYEEQNSEIEKRPFYSRELRIDYIITLIEKLENKSAKLDAFYAKWKHFNDIYMFNQVCLEQSLKDEFESESFDLHLDNITQELEFVSQEVDLTPIEDKEIRILHDNLTKLYNLYQKTFLLYDNDKYFPSLDALLEVPSFDIMFQLLRPQLNTEIFANILLVKDESQDSQCMVTIEDLEKYHYIVMSEYASSKDVLKACQQFINCIENIIPTISIREMAAEVYCEMSNLIGFENLDEKEMLLNRAETYVLERNGTFISNKAKDIYIRIAHRLCDVYEYQLREDISLSFRESALDLIRRHNIRTIDSAWFISEQAQRIMYEAKKHNNSNLRSESKDLFIESIEILQSINSPTEDSTYYLDLYKEFLSQI